MERVDLSGEHAHVFQYGQGVAEVGGFAFEVSGDAAAGVVAFGDCGHYAVVERGAAQVRFLGE